MKWTLLLLALLGGCGSISSHVHVSSGSPSYGVSVHVDGGTSLAVLLGVAFFATAYQQERDFGGSSHPVPELAPDRRVSEQDCTRPIDYTLGNIRCK